MKELKFRAWDENEKVMGNVIELHLDENPIRAIIFDEKNQCYTSVNNEKNIVQYTGLKDKNGKEIYKGGYCKSYAQHRGRFKKRYLVICCMG